jgi:general secretion pathway protein M
MTGGTLILPDGRRGQALAVALTLIAAAFLWFTAIAPLLGWHAARASLLAQQRQLAAHMAALGPEIPALQTAVNAAGLQATAHQVLLAGNTDVIAGANLQSALQALAAQAGTSLDSAALLPAQPAGALRRISVQVSVTAAWPVLIALLEAIGKTRPRMIVDQLSVTSTAAPGTDQVPPMQASFTVTGFCASS